MLADRFHEMTGKGQTNDDAPTHLAEAIYALSEDDYHMGRKKGYETAVVVPFEIHRGSIGI
jgi:hypothetical protein